MKNKIKKELLEQFAEYAHTRYKGCSMENGQWVYSYNTEVVCMIDDFLKQEEVSLINKVFPEMKESIDGLMNLSIRK
jgi:hypothetical protein